MRLWYDILIELRLCLVLLDHIEALRFAIASEVLVEALLVHRLRGSIVCGWFGLQWFLVFRFATTRTACPTKGLLDGLVLPGFAPCRYVLNVQQTIAILRGDMCKVRLLVQRLLQHGQIPMIDTARTSIRAEGKWDLSSILISYVLTAHSNSITALTVKVTLGFTFGWRVTRGQGDTRGHALVDRRPIN